MMVFELRKLTQKNAKLFKYKRKLNLNKNEKKRRIRGDYRSNSEKS